MNYTEQLECKKWQFENIPEFKQGEMSPMFVNWGCGLEPCREDDNSADSFMHTFYGVEENDVKEYTAELESKGFEKTFENRIGNNTFYQFRVEEGLLYISYMKSYNVARFILDRCHTCDAAHFGYSDFVEQRTDSVFAQYSLHYDEMIKGITCDCGMNYVYRLRDNSLIIIDGGESEQATDIAVADFMKFLHELTDAQNGTPVRVALWFCTHAHNDHCDFISKIIRFHSDEVCIERVAFNFPNPQTVKHSPSMELMKERVREKYPDADYIKLHAGMKFNIADCRFEIFTSAEDALGVDEEDLYPSTNSTSTMFKVTLDGVSTFFLADCGEDNGELLYKSYEKDLLDCNFVQAAHHGINSIYDVYEKIDAQKLLLPQCQMNMDTRFSQNFEHFCQRYGRENILLAHNETDIFTIKDGKYTWSKRAHVGTAYDNSEM